MYNPSIRESLPNRAGFQNKRTGERIGQEISLPESVEQTDSILGAIAFSEALEESVPDNDLRSFEVINDPPAIVKGRRGEAADVGHPVERKHRDGAVGLDDVGMDLLELGRVGEAVEEISWLDLKAGEVLVGFVVGGILQGR
ncbi:hypothetical protein ACLOJK_041682 [Asimina triloba]